MTGYEGLKMTSFSKMEKQLKPYFESKDWWIIPGYDVYSNRVMAKIEDEFYSGKKNADFHLAMLQPDTTPELQKEKFGGIRMMGLAFAHKKHMDHRQLSKLLGLVIDSKQDIIMTFHEDHKELGEAAAAALNRIMNKMGI